MRHPDRLLLGLLFMVLAAIGSSAFADDALPVEVRIGVHEHFGRLVFDDGGGGDLKVAASLDQDTLTIRFDQPVAVSVDQIRRRLGSYFSDIGWTQPGRELSGHLARKVTLRAARPKSGETVIDFLDLDQPQAAPAAEATPVPPRPAADEPAVPLQIHVRHLPAGDELDLTPARALAVVTSESDGHAVLSFDHPVRLHAARISAALAPSFRPLTVASDGRSLSFSLPDGSHVSAHGTPDDTIIDVTKAAPPPAVPLATAAPAQPAPPVAAAPKAAEPAPSRPLPSAVTAPLGAPPPTAVAVPVPTRAQAAPASVNAAPDRPDGPPVAVHVLTADDGSPSIRFDWNEPTAASVFRRDDIVWIAFNRTRALDLGDAKPGSRAVFVSIRQQRTSSRTGTVARVETAGGAYPAVRRAGNEWIIDFKSERQKLGAPIAPVIVTDNGPYLIQYPVLDPSGPLTVDDPDAGDMVVFVPLPELGQGIEETTDYPDFRIFRSVQGLAFRPFTDELTVRQLPNLIEITAPNGLQLTPPGEIKAKAAPPKLDKRLMQPTDWQGDPAKPFAEKRLALLDAIVSAESNRRSDPRLDLAKFYLAYGLGPETLAVLDRAAADTPTLDDNRLVRLMRGAAHELIGQKDVAAPFLTDPSLDGFADAAAWRAGLAAMQDNWSEAATDAAEGRDVLQDYPLALARHLAQPMAEALFRSGDPDSATQLLDIVLENSPSPGQRYAALMLKGRIIGQAGDVSGAVGLWRQIAASPLMDRARAEASFALAVHAYEAKEVSLPDTITALDRLRYAWRGDEFEVLLLRKLADLYGVDADPRMAFQTLQRIPAQYPDTPAAKDAMKAMQQIFVSQFLGPDAEKTPPLAALSVFGEFKELVPTGEQGDVIIRRLADRLVAVDLLDRAGALLDDQVRHRLTGIDQARVATQLALVRILDHQPQAALDALGSASLPSLPADLSRQTAELKARALTDLDRTDDALAALKDDPSPDADRLRADIYSKTGQWPALITLLQNGLADPGPDGSLDPATTGRVLRLATALVIANRRDDLIALDRRFGAAMDKTSSKDAFRLLAGAPDAGGAQFKTISSEVAQISDSQSFMQGYREKLQREPLSAIN